MRGFSLYEALVTLFLFFLALGLVAGLVSRYQAVLRSAEASEAVVALESALARMEAEVKEATTILLPANDLTPLDRLRFEKVSPALSGSPPRPGDRLPYPALQPLTFQPDEPAWLVTVDYEVVDGRLIRRAGNEEQLLAPELESLVVELEDQMVSFRLSTPSGTVLVGRSYKP